METNSTEFLDSYYDVTFKVSIKDSLGNLLTEEIYACQSNSKSWQMNWDISYNVQDNLNEVKIEIEAFDNATFGVLGNFPLDLTGGNYSDNSDPLGLYFSLDLATGYWIEDYGGDADLDGVTSGLDDGKGGNEVTLWYWLST